VAVDDGLTLADLEGLDDDDLLEVVDRLPDVVVARLMASLKSEDAPKPTLSDTANLLGMRQAPYLDLMDERIERALAVADAGGSARLIVETPPRYGKSMRCSVALPVHVLRTRPGWPVVITSYSDDIAVGWGREVRRAVEAGAVEGVSVARDAGAVSAWQTTAGSRIAAMSVRRPLTGRGARLLVVDDPVKDMVDAMSSAMRNQVWDWWTSVASTRLEPGNVVVVVMTRWHEDDIVGRLLDPRFPGDPTDWDVLRIPAVAEDDDVLGREPGTPLTSVLVPGETVESAGERLAQIRETVGETVWAGLYQQRPVAVEGAMVKREWLRWWTTDPALVSDTCTLFDPASADMVVDSWDTALGGADYTVGQRWATKGSSRYLLDQHRSRDEFASVVETMRRWCSTPSDYGEQTPSLVLVEKTAAGAPLLSVLRSEVPTLKPVVPRGSKETRLLAVSPQIEGGHVRFPHPRQAPWVTALVDEMVAFPHGSHDDQVDALTQALDGTRTPRATVTVPVGRPTSPLSQRGALRRPDADGLASLRRPSV
jgi:predicted phage terminase large subunit-like protein